MFKKDCDIRIRRTKYYKNYIKTNFGDKRQKEEIQ